LEQAFCKWFKILKKDEEVYMQLWNNNNKSPNVSKFTMNTCWNYLIQVKAIDVFLTIVLGQVYNLT
jgi:hypothetical protein